LVLDPRLRLGSGPLGSALGFDSLKRHEFFRGIDFAKAIKMKPPLDPALLAKLHIDKRKTISGFESPTERDSSDSFDGEDERGEKPYMGPTTTNEKVLKEGIVDKKCGWLFYYNRKLVLTTLPRLSYYKPKKNEYKVSLARALP
jgi:hypothetical protein